MPVKMYPARGCPKVFPDKGIDGLKVFEMVLPPRRKIVPSPLQPIRQGVGGVGDELVEETIQTRGRTFAKRAYIQVSFREDSLRFVGKRVKKLPSQIAFDLRHPYAGAATGDNEIALASRGSCCPISFGLCCGRWCFEIGEQQTQKRTEREKGGFFFVWRSHRRWSDEPKKTVPLVVPAL